MKHRAQLGNGCPLCSGQKPCRCRSVAGMHPELMKQWGWEGNQGTDPYGKPIMDMRVAWPVGCCASSEGVLWSRLPGMRKREQAASPFTARISEG